MSLPNTDDAKVSHQPSSNAAINDPGARTANTNVVSRISYCECGFDPTCTQDIFYHWCKFKQLKEDRARGALVARFPDSNDLTVNRQPSTSADTTGPPADNATANAARPRTDCECGFTIEDVDKAFYHDCPLKRAGADKKPEKQAPRSPLAERDLKSVEVYRPTIRGSSRLRPMAYPREDNKDEEAEASPSVIDSVSRGRPQLRTSPMGRHSTTDTGGPSNSQNHHGEDDDAEPYDDMYDEDKENDENMDPNLDLDMDDYSISSLSTPDSDYATSSVQPSERALTPPVPWHPRSDAKLGDDWTLYLAFYNTNDRSRQPGEKAAKQSLLLLPQFKEPDGGPAKALRAFVHREVAGGRHKRVFDRVPGRMPGLECVVRIPWARDATKKFFIEDLMRLLNDVKIESTISFNNDIWLQRAIDKLSAGTYIDPVDGSALWTASFKNSIQLRRAKPEGPPSSPHSSPVPTYIFNHAKKVVEICGSEGALW